MHFLHIVHKGDFSEPTVTERDISWNNHRGISLIFAITAVEYGLTKDIRSRQPVENLLKSWKKIHLRCTRF